MSRRRQNSIGQAIYYGVIAVFLTFYGSVAAFWKSLTPQEHQIFLILGGVVLVSGLGFIVVLIQYRKHKRREAWQRAMKTWNQSSKSGTLPEFRTARDLSPAGLEKFAMQVYKKMGYVVQHTGQSGDHGVDVRLVDPNGKTELVQCKQWNRPVGEPQVRDLMGAMTHEKAVRGYIWAPGGFSFAARQWAKGKQIILADNEEIGRLVESTFSD